MNKSYAVCIPTYKRAYPLSLNLINDDVDIHYFVRKDDLELGFYDHWLYGDEDRLQLHALPEHVHELGETRQAILDYCKTNDIDYCIMLDDGVYKFGKNNRKMASYIESIIEKFEDCYGSTVAGSFVKRGYMSTNGKRGKIKRKISCDYFGNVPTQAIIINVKRFFEFGLSYKSIEEVGFEDCAFFIDAVKKGCFIASDNSWTFEAIVPNAKKEGGSHEFTVSLEEKYDRQMKLCKDYIGDMYGVQVQKKYRNYADSMMTMIEIDCDYIREVFLNHRNEKLIENQFKLWT